MTKHFQLTRLLSLSVLLYASPGFAQDDEPVAEPDPDIDSEETVAAGQEVEINEDNYRQFMELRDPRLQRNVLPETAYRSRAGMQKIEKLPEESQKHLRNQLREIIIQGDQWQPGDEGTEYPYVPSEAAKTDQALQKLEAEAWGELVGNYHKREAEIYANSSRSNAANATAGTSGGKSGSNQDSNGGKQGSPGGSAGQAGENQQNSQQSSQQGSLGQNSSTDSYSPNSVNDPNAQSMEGVSQNALEFLQQSGNHNADAGNTGIGSPDPGDGQGTEQAEAGQQGGQEQNQVASPSSSSSSSSSSSPDSSNESQAEATEGAVQNALEYLMGEDTPTDRSANNEPETGESVFDSNPLPELPSLKEPAPENNPQQINLQFGTSSQAGEADSGGSEGTLTIKDLINAQGIGGAAGTVAPPGDTSNEEAPVENPPAEDGG